MSVLRVGHLVDALSSQFDLGPGTPIIEPLHLAENATHTISFEGEDRPRSVLRVYRTGRHSEQRIRSELQWVEALAEAGARTARPQRSSSGELTGSLHTEHGATRFAVLDFIPSDPIVPDLTRTLTALGAASGRLQSHARSWEPSVGFDRPAWDAESTLTEATSWGRWLTTDLPPSARDVLLRARARILAELPELSGADRVLQHADLKAINSIWSAGELHIIDFDDCGFSWPFFDLAASLTGLENHPDTPAFVEAWLTGYSTNAEVRQADLAAIPALLMQRRLMILGWLYAHPEGHSGIDRGGVLADTVEMARRYLDASLLPAVH